MSTTYSKLRAQIAALQRQAESTRRSEVAGVVKRMKEAIAVYGITAGDLFGPEKGRIPAKQSSTGAAGYADGDGHTWGGRGPRPGWLRKALAEGKSLEDFLVENARAGAKRTRDAAASKQTASKIAVKYRDGSNTWTGRGSQPRWLKAALESGKTLEQLKV